MFTLPQKVPIENAIYCAAGKHFSYVITKSKEGVKQYYSFGLGDTYVLGNLSDDSEFSPYEIDHQDVLKGQNIT